MRLPQGMHAAPAGNTGAPGIPDNPDNPGTAHTRGHRWASLTASPLTGGNQVHLLTGGDAQVHEKLTNRFERILIVQALAHTAGRRVEAAQVLGIGRNTITRKIQELGLDGARGNDQEQTAG